MHSWRKSKAILYARKRLSHAAGKLFSEKSIIYIHGYSKKNEFEYWVSTQNSLKMSYSTQNSNPKLIKNESLNSKPRLKNHWKWDLNSILKLIFFWVPMYDYISIDSFQLAESESTIIILRALFHIKKACYLYKKKYLEKWKDLIEWSNVAVM
jgi:hypothetical protein